MYVHLDIQSSVIFQFLQAISTAATIPIQSLIFCFLFYLHRPFFLILISCIINSFPSFLLMMSFFFFFEFNPGLLCSPLQQEEKPTESRYTLRANLHPSIVTLPPTYTKGISFQNKQNSKILEKKKVETGWTWRSWLAAREGKRNNPPSSLSKRHYVKDVCVCLGYARSVGTPAHDGHLLNTKDTHCETWSQIGWG